MIERASLFMVLTFACALLSSCSSGNSNAIIDPDTGTHIANWYVLHRSAFLTDPLRCTQCHGDTLRGGMSGVTCFQSSFKGLACHAGGPGHGLASWSTGTVHGLRAEQDFWYCRFCHGTNYRGSAITSVSCYQCHNGPGLNHPGPGWVVPLSSPTTSPYHKTDAADCTKCHGATYAGGGAHVACTKCHMEDHTRVHILAWYPDVQANHRAYAAANGTAKCQNSYCHGLPTLTTDVWNGLSGPHCNGTCHGWPPD